MDEHKKCNLCLTKRQYLGNCMICGIKNKINLCDDCFLFHMECHNEEDETLFNLPKEEMDEKIFISKLNIKTEDGCANAMF